jgi:hypothetical protein
MSEEKESEQRDAPRRSSRRSPAAAQQESEGKENEEPAEPAVEIEEVADEEESGPHPTPSQRRRDRLEYSQPPREASSCEFSSDGKQILACMMKSTPLLFDVERTTPVLALQSHGDFAGYSNTCTLKSAVYAGPDERFCLAGSDNFGLYLWDRTKPKSDILASPESHPGNTCTFLNACKVIRGHRSIPNNMRFHDSLAQIYSCGVEKVVRVFHCARAAEVPSPPDADEMVLAEASSSPVLERDESALRSGDVLSSTEARHMLQRHHLAAPSPPPGEEPPASASSSGSKRKLEDDGSDAQLEEKKAKPAEPSQTSGDVTMAAAAAPSPASSTPAGPRRSSRAATVAASAAPPGGRRSSRLAEAAAAAAASSSSSRRGSGSSAAGTSNSPPLDPLYRTVRTYLRPRNPFSRLQCAFLMSGGANAFGDVGSLFEDGDPEEAAEIADNMGDEDGMAEDRRCIAQFDW